MKGCNMPGSSSITIERIVVSLPEAIEAWKSGKPVYLRRMRNVYATEADFNHPQASRTAFFIDVKFETYSGIIESAIDDDGEVHCDIHHLPVDMPPGTRIEYTMKWRKVGP